MESFRLCSAREVSCSSAPTFPRSKSRPVLIPLPTFHLEYSRLQSSFCLPFSFILCSDASLFLIFSSHLSSIVLKKRKSFCSSPVRRGERDRLEEKRFTRFAFILFFKLFFSASTLSMSFEFSNGEEEGRKWLCRHGDVLVHIGKYVFEHFSRWSGKRIY